MGLTALYLFISVWSVQNVVNGQLECQTCESIAYPRSDFTNVDQFEDQGCIEGKRNDLNTVECADGYNCTLTEGFVTWFVDGHGFVDAWLVKRACLGGGGLQHVIDSNSCFDNHYSYLLLYQLFNKRFSDREMTDFDGQICGCDSSGYCYNEPGEVASIPKSHTPEPDVPGLQCLFCDHNEFHDPIYEEFNDLNPSCAEADIKNRSVYYHTCREGGVCGIANGTITYLSFDDTKETYFLRDCLYGLEEYNTTVRDDGMICLDQSNVSTVVASHIFENPIDRAQVEFSGEVCFCTTDFCELPGYVGSGDNGSGCSRVRGQYFASVLILQVVFQIIRYICNSFP